MVMKILYAHTSTPGYVRCLKILGVLAKVNANVVFFGARRSGAAPRAAEPGWSNIEVRLRRATMPHGLKSMFALIGYLVELRALIIKENPEVLVLTNEELMLATIFVSGKRYIILDAIDALDIRWNAVWPIRSIAKLVTNFARRRADTIIEVEEFRRLRREQFLAKTVVVRNAPSMQMTRLVPEKANIELPSLFIYASGSLNPAINGIENLVSAIAGLPDVKLVVAGFIEDAQLLGALFGCSRVLFLGPVDFETSLYIASKSAAIFAHYQPVNDNFRLAAPNKVYEAMALGKPILINAEALISGFCEEHNFGFVSRFGDIEALREQIVKLLSDGIEPHAREKLIASFESEFCWERQESKLREVVAWAYSGLG